MTTLPRGYNNRRQSGAQQLHTARARPRNADKSRWSSRTFVVDSANAPNSSYSYIFAPVVCGRSTVHGKTAVSEQKTTRTENAQIAKFNQIIHCEHNTSVSGQNTSAEHETCQAREKWRSRYCCHCCLGLRRPKRRRLAVRMALSECNQICPSGTPSFSLTAG